MKSTLAPVVRVPLGVLLAALSAGVVAAPPPGHPTPDAAMQMLAPGGAPARGELPRSGKVLSHMDANQYTYIEVEENGQKLWLAAPRTALKDGDAIRFPDGVVMRDFYSKLLQRTFPAVIFVGAVEVGKAD